VKPIRRRVVTPALFVRITRARIIRVLFLPFRFEGRVRESGPTIGRRRSKCPPRGPFAERKPVLCSSGAGRCCRYSFHSFLGPRPVRTVTLSPGRTAILSLVTRRIFASESSFSARSNGHVNPKRVRRSRPETHARRTYFNECPLSFVSHSYGTRAVVRRSTFVTRTTCSRHKPIL